MKRTILLLLLVSMGYLLPAQAPAESKATANEISPVYSSKTKGSALYSVKVTVVTELLGVEVPVNLAIVSGGLLGDVLTNVLGIAPPIQLAAGAEITVSGPLIETTTIVFDPSISKYLSDEIGITIRIRNKY